MSLLPKSACSCPCHTMGGMFHVVACCTPDEYLPAPEGRTIPRPEGRHTMAHWFDLEGVYDMDYDGGTGSLQGFHVDGHGIDPALLDLLLADTEHLEGELTGYDPDYAYDWDVREVWVGTEPFVDDEGEEADGSFLFVYSNEPKEGYRAVTHFDQAQIARHFCVVHPFEPYLSSIPAERFYDSVFNYILADLGTPDRGRQPIPYVHLCRDCARYYDELYQEGLRQARIEIEFEDRQAEEKNRQMPHAYKPNEEDGQVYCFHVVDPRPYRGVPHICGLAEDAEPHIKEQTS